MMVAFRVLGDLSHLSRSPALTALNSTISTVCARLEVAFLDARRVMHSHRHHIARCQHRRTSQHPMDDRWRFFLKLTRVASEWIRLFDESWPPVLGIKNSN